MTFDRVQAAWHYINREVWRPLFNRFRDAHPDLPIEVVRTMLVRTRGMPQIFVEPGLAPALDRLRGDVATCLDLPDDARSALARVKPQFFTGGRAIAVLLSDIAIALKAYENNELDQFYLDRLGRFLQRHTLHYRLDIAPLKLTPLLHGEMDALYGGLRTRAAADVRLREALTAFENAWERQATDWNQLNAKEAIRTASLLAENMLVSASNGRENEFNRALVRMRNGNRFPSNDFANIFDRAYTFANNYPNIRHPGDASCVKRDLRREDAVLSALVFVGLSACAHNLCTDDG
ncbi:MULTISPECIES: hypothetical protein [unclassified Inquilinus]|uniref:hypothetical protein n=1 Tax=unclassified Inquilinus TaxID=2645927 RepID=UPI003F906AEC